MLLLHQIICIVVGDDAVGAFELLGGVAVISAAVLVDVDADAAGVDDKCCCFSG